MPEPETWQRFERGETEIELASFIAGAVPDHPVAIHLKGAHWGPGACAIIAALRPGIDLRMLSKACENVRYKPTFL